MKPTIIAVGNITKDFQLERTKTNDKAVVKFTVACNGGRDETTFLWCIAYGISAENIHKYFGKGTPIHIVGELSQYSDTEKRTHSYCEVRSWSFVNGGAKKENPPPTRESGAAPASGELPDGIEDDVPF